jgi:hypothetical protein
MNFLLYFICLSGKILSHIEISNLGGKIQILFYNKVFYKYSSIINHITLKEYRDIKKEQIITPQTIIISGQHLNLDFRSRL